MTSAHILIADDDDRLRTLFATYLTRQGYRVSQAQDGIDALLRLRQEPVDLLIADANMPRLGGLDLIRRVRQSAETVHIPIILISGVVESEDSRRAIEAGADACLDKAGDLKQFSATIARLLPSTASEPDIANSGLSTTRRTD